MHVCHVIILTPTLAVCKHCTFLFHPKLQMSACLCPQGQQASTSTESNSPCKLLCWPWFCRLASKSWHPCEFSYCLTTRSLPGVKSSVWVPCQLWRSCFLWVTLSTMNTKTRATLKVTESRSLSALHLATFLQTFPAISCHCAVNTCRHASYSVQKADIALPQLPCMIAGDKSRKCVCRSSRGCHSSKSLMVSQWM